MQYCNILVNLCSNTSDKLQIYRDNFEAAYIQATEAFYWVKAPEYLSMHGVENYMRYADSKLREEELRAQKYLEPNTASMQRLTECCVKVLVATFKPAILAECPRMIQHNQTDSEYYFRVCAYLRLVYAHPVIRY